MEKLEKIERDIRNALKIFPKLNFQRISNRVYSGKGVIDIFDNNNVYWDSFNIKIITPFNYPFSFPKVYIIGDRISNEVDRHINNDSSCCLAHLNDEILRAEKGITILQFLNEYVIPFFANQLFYEQHKQWANGDYLHYDDGTLQFYKEQTKLNDIIEIHSLLTKIPLIKKMGRNEKCFCSSDLKLKHCHLKSLEKILLLPLDQIYKDIIAIEKIIKENSKKSDTIKPEI